MKDTDPARVPGERGRGLSQMGRRTVQALGVLDAGPVGQRPEHGHRQHQPVAGDAIGKPLGTTRSWRSATPTASSPASAPASIGCRCARQGRTTPH